MKGKARREAFIFDRNTFNKVAGVRIKDKRRRMRGKIKKKVCPTAVTFPAFPCRLDLDSDHIKYFELPVDRVQNKKKIYKVALPVATL